MSKKYIYIFMDVDLAEVITSVYQKSFTGYKILYII